MQRRASLAIIAAGILPVALFSASLVGGPAWAKAKGRVVKATGTVSCSGVSATIQFKPPLEPGNGVKTEKPKVLGTTFTGCTDSNGHSVSATKVLVTIKATPPGKNGCNSFATGTGSDKIVVKVKWSGFAPTSITFLPGSTSINGAGNGFNASNGIAKGSFATSSAQFDVALDQGSVAAITGCITQSSSETVSSLFINGGSSTA